MEYTPRGAEGRRSAPLSAAPPTLLEYQYCQASVDAEPIHSPHLMSFSDEIEELSVNANRLNPLECTYSKHHTTIYVQSSLELP